MLKQFSTGKFWMVLAATFGVWFTGLPGFTGHAGLLRGDRLLGRCRRRLAGQQRHLGRTRPIGGVAQADQVWNNANGDTALFAGTPGTVTLSGSQNAGGLVFSASGGYTLTGSSGTLNLAGAAPLISVTTATTNTISSILTGSGNVTIQAGTGTVVFTATNAYSGGTTVDSGVLSLTATNGLNLGTGTGAAAITLNGGTLRFTLDSTYGTSSIYSPSISGSSSGITLGTSGGTINVAAVSTGGFAGSETAVNIRGFITGAGNLTVTGG